MALAAQPRLLDILGHAVGQLLVEGSQRLHLGTGDLLAFFLLIME